MSNFQEFPKWVPTPDGVGKVVFSAEEEKLHSEPATMEPQTPKRAGRPRKELPSFLTGAINGDSTNPD